MDQQANGGTANPRSYTEDYKRQVVNLVISSGRTPTAVAGEVGLHPTVLCRWVRQYAADAAKAEAPRPTPAPVLKPSPVPMVPTTNSRHAFPVAPNLLERKFSETSRPNQVWLADLTSIPTGEGWLTWPPSWISTPASQTRSVSLRSSAEPCVTTCAPNWQHRRC